MTDFSELLKSGRIKPGRFSSKQIKDRLAIARRDLGAARSNLDSNPEWAYIIAYNAMHQAGLRSSNRSLHGRRVRGENQRTPVS